MLLDGQPATRPALRVPADAQLVLKDTGPQYVSRGALKLQAALDHWQIDPSGCVCLDVGASTGGFTDLLLQRGAACVYAVDVGYGQLHYKLRDDPRVVLLERTNIRYLEALPERVQLAVVDVSFISLRLVLPRVAEFTEDAGRVVALIKPQFEAGRADVKKGGVVRDPAVHRRVVNELQAWSEQQPWHFVEWIESPITGPAGNREFLSLWLRP